MDGDTCRKTPISRSALDKILMPGHLLKITLLMKAQHEGALTPPDILVHAFQCSIFT